MSFRYIAAYYYTINIYNVLKNAKAECLLQLACLQHLSKTKTIIFISCTLNMFFVYMRSYFFKYKVDCDARNIYASSGTRVRPTKSIYGVLCK